MKRLLCILIMIAVLLCCAVCVSAESQYSQQDSFAVESDDVWISLAIGAVIGTITVLVMISQLKSVRSRAGAGDYIRPGSLQIRSRSDIYLYQHTTRVARPKNKD